MSDKGNRISQVVENRQHIIKHCRGKMFTSESLKIVALICMLIDHAGATLFPQCDLAQQPLCPRAAPLQLGELYALVKAVIAFCF